MNTNTLNKRLWRILSAMLVLAMILTSVSIPVFAEDKTDVSNLPEFEVGLIDTANEFKISSADTLKALASAVNAGDGNGTYSMSGKTFYLANDIDLNGDLFTPIADLSSVADGFGGTFDGNYYTVKGMYVSGVTNYKGLFGILNGGVVKNLSVEGTVTSTNNNVGGIVGKIFSGTVENCSFDGMVESTKSGAYVGGIAGYCGNTTSQKGTIKNCVNKANIKAVTKGTVGGITGYAKFSEIKSCYNSGNITGASRCGGIVGQAMNGTTITSSYSIGKLDGSGTAADICDFFGGAEISNCYYSQKSIKGTGTGTVNDNCGEIPDENFASILGSEFVEDTENINGGYPILKWQSGGSTPETPKNPSISISGGRTLKMTNSGAQPTTTLTVVYTDMDTTPTVEWSVENGKENMITLDVPENSDTSDNIRIVKPISAGKIKVTAKVVYDNNEYTADADIVIYPYVTTVDIDGHINVGETVRATVNVLGGDEYDYDNYPELVYQWKYLTEEDYSAGNTGSGSYKNISGAINREFTIPEDMAGDYLSVDVTIGGETKSPNTVFNKKIGSSAKKITEQDAAALDDLIDISDIKAAKTIELPKTGENGSTIEWSSDKTAVINAETGAVILPNSGIAKVRLTAMVKYLNESTVKWFDFNVYSQAQIDADKANKLLPVTKTLEALGDFYKMYPEYGTDTNAVNMFKADFDAKAKEIEQNTEGAAISVKSVETIAGGENSKVANDGTITYYYVDPNTSPSEHCGSHNVTFEIEFGGEKTEYTAPVIVYWDVDKVKKAMNDEIMSKVAFEKDESGKTVTESDLSLPRSIDGKKWALISWVSSDNKYISVSNKNQQTPDTLFDPYVGVVKRGAKDTDVTLTATCTFGFTNDNNGGGEKPITLDYVYPVTVKAIDAVEAAKIQKDLEDKLNTGFGKVGLTDAVTGKALAADENGKTEVLNDIQFPTTRDFGIDGKETPVIITTDNPNVVITPDVNNAARVEIIRPSVGKESAEATVTLAITQKDTNISASKTFNLSVPALTQNEIDAEKALMTKVKASYFDGIKGSNASADDIDSNLYPFTEVYEKDDELVWVRDNKNMVGHGIVPTALDGWYELQAWRLFRSSNPAAITHENLLVTKQKNAKAVTVNSALSSETLGKYGRLYMSDTEKYAEYKELADLYYQPVSVDLTVRGTSTQKGVKPLAVTEKINVSFTLMDNKKTLIDTVKYEKLNETTTAFDVFKKAMQESGYKYELKYGTYVPSITMPDGTKLGELDRGKNSGWMYKVNGKIPDVSMGAYGLKDGDSIVVFYTDDYTKEDGMKDYGGGSSSSATGVKKDNNKNNKNKTDDTITDNNNQTISSGTFTDVKVDDWFYDAVKFVYENKIMKGVSDNEFAPNENLSRAMIVTILYRMENEPSASFNKFGDVNADEWYGAAVAWASENGIVNGVSEDEFAPNDNLTREQMAAIIYRYITFKGGDTSVGDNTNILSYTDAESVSEYAVEAICYAVGSGLMKGDSETTLNPSGTATRAETATIIMRLFGIME
jgi:hypothetical protein